MRCRDFDIQNTVPDSQQQTLVALAADAVAHDDGARLKLAACANRDEELSRLLLFLEERYRVEQKVQGAGLVAQGALDWPQEVRDRLAEVLGRIDTAPGFVLSRALAELRKPIK